MGQGYTKLGSSAKVYATSATKDAMADKRVMREAEAAKRKLEIDKALSKLTPRLRFEMSALPFKVPIFKMGKGGGR
jgi:hypothetical protein